MPPPSFTYKLLLISLLIQLTTVLSYTWSCKLWGREYDCDELYTCRPEGCISKRLKTTTMLFVLRCMETGTSYAKFFFGGGKKHTLHIKQQLIVGIVEILSLLQGLVDYYRKRGIILQKCSLWTILLTSTSSRLYFFFLFWLCSHFHWSLASFLMLIMSVWGWLWCDYGLGGGYGDSQHP